MAVNNLLIKRIPLKQPIAQTLFFTNVLSMPIILALAWWEGGPGSGRCGGLPSAPRR